MTVPTRLAAFAAMLGLAFGGAVVAGAAIDPTGETAIATGGQHGGESTGGAETHSGGEPAAGSAGDEGAHGAASGGVALSGLAVSQDGFTLEPDQTSFTGKGPKRFTFRIADDRGRVIRDEYEIESERELHLVVVRRDTAIYEHVHPRKGEDGTWSVELELREPGVYRGSPTSRSTGRSALREGDLGYLHVHPEESVGGNAVAFEATFPTAGRYRLFFQFKTGGRVRTVDYTVEASR